MNWKIVKYIFMSLSVLVVLAYLVFVFVSFETDKDIFCKNLTVNIKGPVQLVNEGEIHQMLNNEGIHPIGTMVNQLQTDRIEHFLKQNPLIKRAVCYHTPTGYTYLEVALREPKMIVATNDNYYVDKERNIMPIPLFSIAYVPIVTGRVTKTMATSELFDFISYIEKDAFWNAQISQIHIADDLKVELIPRIGNTIILLGKLENYDKKLNDVQRLYTQCFNVIGWNRYKSIDVQYENQIVGVKF